MNVWILEVENEASLVTDPLPPDSYVFSTEDKAIAFSRDVLKLRDGSRWFDIYEVELDPEK